MEETKDSQVSNVSDQLKKWMVSENLEHFKISDAKSAFPVIHQNWLELACNSLLTDGYVNIADDRSRIKIFTIVKEKFPVPEVCVQTAVVVARVPLGLLISDLYFCHIICLQFLN